MGGEVFAVFDFCFWVVFFAVCGGVDSEGFFVALGVDDFVVLSLVLVAAVVAGVGAGAYVGVDGHWGGSHSPSLSGFAYVLGAFVVSVTKNRLFL